MPRDRIELPADWHYAFCDLLASSHGDGESKSLSAVVKITLSSHSVAYEVEDHGTLKLLTADLGLAIEAYNEL